MGYNKPISSASPVAILWDYENCAVPANTSGQLVASRLTELGLSYGCVKSIGAYGPVAAIPPDVREQLQISGIRIIDGSTTHNRKDVADKLILTDMFLFALDNPAPATIILVTGDVDFTASVTALKMRGYTFVIVHPLAASRCLRSASHVAIEWYKLLTSNHKVPSNLMVDTTSPQYPNDIQFSDTLSMVTSAPLATSSATTLDLVTTNTSDLAQAPSELVQCPSTITIEEFLQACLFLIDSDTENEGKKTVRYLLSRVGIAIRTLYPTGWRKGNMKRLIQEASQMGCIIATEGDGGYFSIVMNVPAIRWAVKKYIRYSHPTSLDIIEEC